MPVGSCSAGVAVSIGLVQAGLMPGVCTPNGDSIGGLYVPFSPFSLAPRCLNCLHHECNSLLDWLSLSTPGVAKGAGCGSPGGLAAPVWTPLGMFCVDHAADVSTATISKKTCVVTAVCRARLEFEDVSRGKSGFAKTTSELREL